MISLATDRSQAAKRLMLALDFPSPEKAGAFVEKIGAPPVVYKIGLELIYAGGLPFAADLIRAGHMVFIDAKLHDIGNTVEKATANIAALGASFLTVHASDAKTLAAARRGRQEAPLKLLGVTVLTNLTGADFTGQGMTLTVPELVLSRARLARDAGLDGVIASVAEVPRIRAEFGSDFLIVTPGIRPALAATDDQARIATPSDAIRAGADYIVVGRPITAAADPRAALDAILDEIDSTLSPSGIKRH